MNDSVWHRQACSPGRHYMLAKDIYKKYDDAGAIITKIKEGIRPYIYAEPAVRLNLDSPKSNSERAIISIPFESDQEIILDNFARLIFQNLMGYYLNAHPQTSHFGLSNLVLDGQATSLLRREMETILGYFQNRPDIVGQLLNNVQIKKQAEVPQPGKTYLSKVLKQGLDIHVGYRIVLLGDKINCTRVFLPMPNGSDIIDLIYFNIEKILNQGLSAYDESNAHYIKITETLVFKELENLLKRSKEKQNTRKKILNNLQFEIIFEDVKDKQKNLAEDKLYDLLNRTDEASVRASSDQSIQLYASTLSQVTPERMLSQYPSIQVTPIQQKKNVKKDSSYTLKPPIQEESIKADKSLHSEEPTASSSTESSEKTMVPSPPKTSVLPPTSSPDKVPG